MGPEREVLATLTFVRPFEWRLVVRGEDAGVFGTWTEANSDTELRLGERVRWTRNGDLYTAWSH